jgi:SAM-dependent methyltransferase
VSTAYLQRVLNGTTPSAQEWNEHLIAFHAHFENATSGPLSLMRTTNGETSYQFLARRTMELAPAARAILDIGCGDGLLLRKLKRASAYPLELVGVDLSEAEIERARSMLDGATFVCADARTVDLGTERFDAIVSHLTLMIAAQPALILAQARKALRGGAVMLLLMEEVPLDPSLGSILNAGVQTLLVSHEAFVPIIPERASFERDDVMRATLREVGFDGPVEIERHVVYGRFTRAQVWGYAQRIYPFGLLDEPDQQRVRVAVETEVTRRLDADGKVEISLPFRLVIVRG